MAGDVSHPGPDGDPHGRGGVARRRLLRSGRQPRGPDHGRRPRRPDPPVGATAELVAGSLPDGASLRDLGEHRLQDLGRAEHLFQLGHPALPAEFPPLATLDLRPNNLPTETSAFVGREAELAGIRERLDDADVRLVTLTGPGGTGKTRLALRAAADQIDRFTDGVFFVDLVTATDTDAVARAGRRRRSDLPRPSSGRRSTSSDVASATSECCSSSTTSSRSRSRRRSSWSLLGDCPGLKLLVTSRQALRVRGENVVSGAAAVAAGTATRGA